MDPSLPKEFEGQGPEDGNVTQFFDEMDAEFDRLRLSPNDGQASHSSAVKIEGDNSQSKKAKKKKAKRDKKKKAKESKKKDEEAEAKASSMHKERKGSAGEKRGLQVVDKWKKKSWKNKVVRGKLELGSNGHPIQFGNLLRFETQDISIKMVAINLSNFDSEINTNDDDDDEQEQEEEEDGKKRNKTKEKSKKGKVKSLLLPKTDFNVKIRRWPAWSKFPIGKPVPSSLPPPTSADFATAVVAPPSSEFAKVISVKLESKKAGAAAGGATAMQKGQKDEKHVRLKKKKTTTEAEPKKRKPMFAEHLSIIELEEAKRASNSASSIRDKDALIIAPIRVNRKNPRKAYVAPHVYRGEDNGAAAAEKNTTGTSIRDILIDGFKERNRALNGDIVAVKILQEKGRKNSTKEEAKGDNEQLKGIVVAIVESKTEDMKVTGYLRPTNASVARFIPMDKRLSQGLVGRSKWPKEFINEVKLKKEEAETAGTKKGGEAEAKALLDSGKITQSIYKQMLSAILKEKEGSAGTKKDEEAEAKALLDSGKITQSIYKQMLSAIRKEKEGSAGKNAKKDPEEKKAAAVKKKSGGIPEDAPTMIYVAKYQKWSIHQNLPFVNIVESIGMTGNIKAETQALLSEAGVDYDFDGKFLPEHLNCLEKYMEDPSSETSESPWTIPDEEIKKRLDLRNKRICTIDPTTARDLDDALSIDKIPGTNNYRVGVHIADVTHFLEPGSELDKEAKKRATTIYLVQKSLPMLPRVLSENLCSLAPKVDRLAFSCFFTMSQSGKLLSEPKPWYGKTVIRTCCQLDYKTAQKLIDAKTDDIRDDPEYYDELEMAERMVPIEGVSLKDVAQDIKMMNKIAVARRSDRFRTGSLALDRNKVAFMLDENQLPVEMFNYLRQDSNRMIEEFMLLANLLVAEKIERVFPDKALMRMQPPPDTKQLLEMQGFLKDMGHTIHVSSALELHQSLKRLEDKKTENGTSLRAIAELLLTKPMKLAMYTCSGSPATTANSSSSSSSSSSRKKKKKGGDKGEGEEEGGGGLSSSSSSSPSPSSFRHYALNFDKYTHFTSPIRRYVDVVVHRTLAHAINEEENDGFATVDAKHSGIAFTPAPETLYTKDVIDDIAANCNLRKLNSKKAQELSSRVYLALCLKTKPLIKEAIVIDLGYKSFKIMIEDMGIDAQVFVQNILSVSADVCNDEDEVVDAKNEKETQKCKRFLRIVWEEGKQPQKIGIFGKIMVKLTAKMAPPPIDMQIHVINPELKSGDMEEEEEEGEEEEELPNSPPPLSRKQSSVGTDPSYLHDDD